MVYTKRVQVDASGQVVFVERAKEFTFNLAQNAGAYDIATVTGGDILIIGIALYNDVAAGGLTSISIGTNDTTPVAILGSTNLAALTGGLNLTPFTTQTVLGSGKKIRGTIVGTGNAGSVKLAVRYMQLASAANIT